jgi:hypothetical protein
MSASIVEEKRDYQIVAFCLKTNSRPHPENRLSGVGQLKVSSVGAPLQHPYFDLNYLAELRERTCSPDWGSLRFHENQDVLQWQCL